MSPRAALHHRRLLFLLAGAFAGLVMGIHFTGFFREGRTPLALPEKVTMAYASPPSTALADIAFAKGYFRQEGLSVTPVFHTSGKDALKEVIEGRADVATVAETPVMFAIMKGHKLSIIATIQTSNCNNAIIARKDRGILAPGDLAGKRIGVVKGTVAEFYLDTFLVTQGISRKEVTVVNLNPDEMADALSKGEVSAVSTWMPFMGQIREKLGKKGITFLDEEMYTQFFNIVSTREYAGRHPAGIRKMLRALIRAEDFLESNPSELATIVAAFRKVDPAFLRDGRKGNTYSVTLDQGLLLALEDESAWAIKNGLITRTAIPNYLDSFYLDGLASVKPKAVRLVK